MKRRGNSNQDLWTWEWEETEKSELREIFAEEFGRFNEARVEFDPLCGGSLLNLSPDLDRPGPTTGPLDSPPLTPLSKKEKALARKRSEASKKSSKRYWSDEERSHRKREKRKTEEKYTFGFSTTIDDLPKDMRPERPQCFGRLFSMGAAECMGGYDKSYRHLINNQPFREPCLFRVRCSRATEKK